MRSILPLLLALGALFAVVSAPARAAQSYDNCVGFVAALPAVITTQGTWCLDKDLSTAITSGFAVEIAANNVTLDCNGFKLGGLAAGNASQAYGVYSHGHQNITVRNCNIRGFAHGMYLFGAGHLVENNNFNNNLFRGIGVFGDHNRIVGNLVHDTGGRASIASATGIHASADVIGNTIDGVYGDPQLANTVSYGIVIYRGTGHVVRDNRIAGLLAEGTGVPRGIVIEEASGTMVMDNSISRSGIGVVGFGIVDEADEPLFCRGNLIYDFATPLSGCEASTGNLTLP